MSIGRIAGMKGDPDALWKVGEIATVIQLSLPAVYAAMDKGHLKAFRIGPAGGIRVREEDLIAWLTPYAPSKGDRWPSRRTTSDGPQNRIERDSLA